MATLIIINGKEVTNPFVKAFLIFGAICFTSLVAAIVIFVLLPIIGIAATLSFGFVVIFIVATIAGIATLLFVTSILGWMFGSAELRVGKSGKYK